MPEFSTRPPGPAGRARARHLRHQQPGRCGCGRLARPAGRPASTPCSSSREVDAVARRPGRHRGHRRQRDHDRARPGPRRPPRPAGARRAAWRSAGRSHDGAPDHLVPHDCLGSAGPVTRGAVRRVAGGPRPRDRRGPTPELAVALRDRARALLAAAAERWLSPGQAAELLVGAMGSRFWASVAGLGVSRGVGRTATAGSRSAIKVDRPGRRAQDRARPRPHRTADPAGGPRRLPTLPRTLGHAPEVLVQPMVTGDRARGRAGPRPVARARWSWWRREASPPTCGTTAPSSCHRCRPPTRRGPCRPCGSRRCWTDSAVRPPRDRAGLEELVVALGRLRPTCPRSPSSTSTPSSSARTDVPSST